VKDNPSQPPEAVLRMLREQSTLSLATASRAGTPHVAPVFYIVDDELRLYWFSEPKSRHSRDLAASPAAAASVFVPTDHWREICGIQLRGTASVVREPARRAAVAAVYTERFALGPEFDALLARHRLYEFRPAWIRYLYNGVEFGYKVEFRFPRRRKG